MCSCCEIARLVPTYPVHCPSCAPCGGRLIRAIQRLPIAKSEAAARCRAMLAVWVAHGHAEIEIRRLAKLADAPLAPLAPVLSEPPRKRGG